MSNGEPGVGAVAAAVGALARQVVHDLNNARSLIENYASLALDTLPADAAVRADLEAIAGASAQYAAVVATLESLAWPGEVTVERVDVEEWLVSAVSVPVEMAEGLRAGTGRPAVLVPADLGKRALNHLVDGCGATAVRVEIDHASGEVGIVLTGRARRPAVHRLGEWFADAAFATAGGRLTPLDDGYVVTLRGGEPRRAPTVILVEDQPALRLLAERILAQRGYRVVATADVPDALDAVHGHDPAEPLVIVTDLELPSGSGLDLLDEVKRSRPDARIAVITAHDRPGGVDPATVWITKPFTASDLVGGVEQALTAPAG